MPKKKRDNISFDAADKALQIAQNNFELMEAEYKRELDTKPEYSLVVDPESKYNMDLKTKQFVRQYIEVRNINAAGMMCGIDSDSALELYMSYPVQQEIRRISRALYHRQFNKKMMSLSEIGGYLSSLIEDSDLPVADRLSTREKLPVIRLLIELNQLKMASMGDPSVLLMRDVNVMVKDLSVGAIKAMLEQTRNVADTTQRAVVNEINAQRSIQGEPILAPEEAAYLESLSAEEAMKLLNEQYK